VCIAVPQAAETLTDLAVSEPVQFGNSLNE
jgi:hypothetical protein